MNAIVGIRAHDPRTMPTRTQQKAVSEQLMSLTKANIVGQLTKAADLVQLQGAGKATGASAADAINGQIDQQQFLTLLVTQLQNQDPLSPMQDLEMVSQLTQFASLEQMTNLNSQFNEMAFGFGQLNLISASGLVGQSITGFDVNGEIVDGAVDRVFMQDSNVFLVVGDHMVPLQAVGSIGEMQPADAADPTGAPDES